MEKLRDQLEQVASSQAIDLKGRVPRRPRSCENPLPAVSFFRRKKMSTAAQVAFDETAEYMSPEVSCKHVQLLATLMAQATRNVEFRTLIEGFVDPIGRAMHCDCAYIALLDPEDSQTFREFALQYPNRNRVQQLPVISREEGQRLSRVVELGQSVTFVGP